MNLLVISILIRLIALGFSIFLIRKLKDWRIGFLALMLGFMALRQTLTLVSIKKSGEVNLLNQLTELPGLIVSVLAFLSVLFLRKIIEERKRSEQALRESQDNMRGVIDNTTAVIYIKDLQGNYIQVNRQFETLFHITTDQITGKNDHHVFPKEIADAFMVNDQEVARTGVSTEFEEVVKQDDGLHTYISIKFPLLNSQGRPRAVCGISTDITERKQAEEQIKLRARQQEAIAKFGLFAFEYQTIQQLMDRAVELVTEILDAPYAHVMELLPDGKGLLVRAAVGWPEDLIGQ